MSKNKTGTKHKKEFSIMDKLAVMEDNGKRCLRGSDGKAQLENCTA